MLIWNVPATQYALPELTPIAISGSTTAARVCHDSNTTGTAGKVTYIEGFDLQFGSASVAGNSSITITGLTNTLSYNLGVPAGADTISGTRGSGLSIRFPEPLPATASNTAIVVDVRHRSQLVVTGH